MNEQHSIAGLKQHFSECQRAVVFTGAGISTESGIPDFRSPGGIWSKYKPIEFSDFVSSEEARKQDWQRRVMTVPTMRDATPNRGHRAVCELVRRGQVTHVITQNIDGLHEKSGVPANKIIELHGNATYAKCLSCGHRHELAPIFEAFERDETVPTCNECGGIVKSATISFGQALPEAEMHRAQEATLQCDLFLAIGSSLVVYPAAGFPAIAKQNGARLVIINREPTGMDDIADLVLHEQIGDALGDAVGIA